MRSHAILHSYVHSAEYTNYVQYNCEDAPYIATVEKMLTENRIESASKKCFLNYFKQLPNILSKAFTRSNIKSGWTASGICPPDPHQILANCTQLRDMSQNDINNLLDALPDLIEKARLNGILTDEDITEMVVNLCEQEAEHRNRLREKMTTMINNMDNRCLNGQRAVWYFKRDVLEKRQREEQQRRAVTQQRQMSAISRVVTENIPQILQEHPPIQQAYDPNIHSCYRPCDNDCISYRSFNPDPSVDDGWRMCCVAGCNRWYCHKQLCQNRLTKHIQSCLRHKTMKETIQQMRNAALSNAANAVVSNAATAAAVAATASSNNNGAGRGRGGRNVRGRGGAAGQRDGRGGRTQHVHPTVQQQSPVAHDQLLGRATRGGRGRGRASGRGGRTNP
jgi:hypothetical protein